MRILFHPGDPKNLKNMKPVLSALLARGDEVALLIDFQWADSEKDLAAELKAMGARCLGQSPKHGDSTLRSSPSRGRGWGKLLPSDLRLGLGTFLEFKRYLKKFRGVVAEFAPEVVVTGGEISAKRSALLKLAQEARARTLLLPVFWVPARTKALQFESRADSNRLRPLRGFWPRVITALVPNLALPSAHGPALLNRAPGEALALWLLGVWPSNPWVCGSSGVERVAASSKDVISEGVAAGVPASKYLLTYKPTDDFLVQQMKASPSEHRKRLGLPDRPTLLLNPPHLAEHRLADWPRHWKEMEFLFSECEKLKAEGFEVVLTLHPSCVDPKYKELALTHGLLLPEGGDLYRLLPAADVFATVPGSSTVKLAAASKALVLLDFYQDLGLQGLPELIENRVDFVFVTNKAALFEKALEVLKDPEARERVLQAQQKLTNAWGASDGRSVERIVGLVDELGVQSVQSETH